MPFKTWIVNLRRTWKNTCYSKRYQKNRNQKYNVKLKEGRYN